MASSMDITIKPHPWWENHINHRNAKWLANSLEEMERNAKSMLKLIEDDGDSFAKRAETYYKSRPQLIEQVHEFERMFRTLAERYDQMMVDLQRNVSTDMHPHSPVAPDLNSEPSTPKLNRYRSSRAAGFDVFLRHDLDLSREVSPGPHFEEPGASYLHNYPILPLTRSEEALTEKTILMDSELPQQENVGLIELQLKIASYEVEIAQLKAELNDAKQIREVEEDTRSTETDVSDPEKVRAVFEELKVVKGRLDNLAVQNEKLSTENKLEYELIHKLQDQIKEAQKEAVVLRSKLDLAMAKVSKREEKVGRLKGSLIDREVEIRGLKEASENSKKTSERNGLKVDTEKAGQMEALKNDLNELKLKYDSLTSERDGLIADTGLSDELKIRVGELEEEVERQRLLVSEVEEEKREAIRQLCFSIEHYRKGYRQSRKVSAEHKVHPVLVAL